MSDDRELPWSEEAEKGTIGAMLLEPLRMLPMALRELGTSGAAFFVPAHQYIWAALLEMEKKNGGADVDLLTLGESLRRNEKIDQVGGEGYLEQILNETPTAAHGEFYLDIVRQKWVLRREISLCREVEQEAYRQESGDAHVKQVAPRFLELVGERTLDRTNLQVMQGSIGKWEAAKRGDESARGLALPWPRLNEILCGLETGTLIVAGRPSAGKSTLELGIAENLASHGLGVARVALDDPWDLTLERMMAHRAGVSLPKLKMGFAKENQLAATREAAEEIGAWPMWINDRDREIRAICSWIRSMRARHNIRCFTLDYIQQVTCAEMWKANDNARVSYISAALKQIQIELGIPGVVLSQLSREGDKDSRPPKLSDLRDSGALEQDASKVVFLFQDAKKHKAMEEAEPGATKHRRPVWADIAKNKNGETGRVPLWMRPPYFRFDESLGNDFEGGKLDELEAREQERVRDAAEITE